MEGSTFWNRGITHTCDRSIGCLDIDIIGEIVYKRNREHDWRH